MCEQDLKPPMETNRPDRATSGLTETPSPGRDPSGSLRYPIYALCVLFLVNVFILLDRQIVTVLMEDIKADLGLSDAHMGFIYGTGLAVFYAIFSIPLGRLADVTVRKNVLAACVTAWSVMNALTGLSRNFVSFALCRVGVGIGESGEAPAALSMLADYFPRRLHATAMSIWAAGVPVGAGLGVYLGGVILDAWASAYPDPALVPFGLRGWQVAFFLVALPGPFLALLFISLKEPVRGLREGVQPVRTSRPFLEVWKEMQAVIPLVSLLHILRLGGTVKAIATNLLVGAGLCAFVIALIMLTGSMAQWIALGLGGWCVSCWAQSLSLKDRASFEMIFQCRSLQFSNLGLAGYVFITAGIGGWIVPYLMRTHGLSAGETGSVIGGQMIVCGFLGAALGGALADWLERYTPRARLVVMLFSLLICVPVTVCLLLAKTTNGAFWMTAVYFAASSSWSGIGPSIATGLVMPRMRGVSSALYLITIALLGISLGPYTIGFISDVLTARGASPAEALRQAMMWSLLSSVFTAVMLILSAIYIPEDSINAEVASGAR